MRKITSLAVAVALLVSPVAHPAEPQPQDDVGLVAPIRKGEPAPFDGMLLSPRAYAELQVAPEHERRMCEADAERERALLEARLNRRIEILEAKAAAERERRIFAEKMNERRVNELTAEIARSEKRARRGDFAPLWFAGGVVGGMLLMLGGAHIVKSVR